MFNVLKKNRCIHNFLQTFSDMQSNDLIVPELKCNLQMTYQTLLGPVVK